ncbi:MAG: hypothetical protein WAM11_02930 [Cyanobium sp.]
MQNASKSAIPRLEVREKNGSWDEFDRAGGLAAGQKVRIDWAQSTDHGDGKQCLRATFADGTTSEPAVFACGEGLDTPMVFQD